MHPALQEEELTRSERISGVIADFAGSIHFVVFHALLFTGWIVLAGMVFKIDKFPFNFLTMAVSLEAIFLTTFVMISQNRQEERSEKLADSDYQINLKAEEGVTQLALIVENQGDEISAIKALSAEMHGWVKALHDDLDPQNKTPLPDQ